MKERPIPCKAHEVRAILDGRKTQTRRIIKPQPSPCGLRKLKSGDIDATGFDPAFWYGVDPFTEARKCPYGQPGDRLWVKESGWERPERTQRMMREGADTWEPFYYDADGLSDGEVEFFKAQGFKRRPSIHMPRWASRITLEVESVRVESLTEIRERDARAEGIERIPRPEFGDYHWRNYGPPALINIGTHAEREVHYSDPIGSYKSLWNSINGQGSWDSNPWVWVIEFKKI